jgi:hypothetical protein
LLGPTQAFEASTGLEVIREARPPRGQQLRAPVIVGESRCRLREICELLLAEQRSSVRPADVRPEKVSAACSALVVVGDIEQPETLGRR